MFMHFSSNYISLLQAEFQPPEFSFSWTYGAGQLETQS